MEDLRKFLNETNEMVKECLTEARATDMPEVSKKSQKIAKELAKMVGEIENNFNPRWASLKDSSKLSATAVKEVKYAKRHLDFLAKGQAVKKNGFERNMYVLNELMSRISSVLKYANRKELSKMDKLFKGMRDGINSDGVPSLPV